MKKILFTVLLFSMWATLTMAQNKDQRTLSTKIADLLAQMPAKDSAHLSDDMQEIAAMGENGLSGIAELLADPGKGDNTKPEYAISGFSYYVTQPGREEWRKMSERAYCQALSKVTHPVNKSFIMSQLQIVGQSDDAVSCLKTYLNDDEHLSDHAARALIQINSPTAKEALLTAAQHSQGKARLSLIKALGDSRYHNAINFISPLANSNDKMLAKLALYSLANIGDVSSAQILGNAALNSNFTFEETNATDSYLLYLNRLLENGNNKLAEKLASSLMKNAKQDNQVHTRIAATTLVAQSKGEKDTKMLLSASSDKNPEYRAAALMIASKNINPATTSLWLKKLKTSNPEVQAEIITMLGNARDESALADITKYLQNKNSKVRIAAIAAVGKTGGEKTLPALLSLLKNGDSEEIAAIKNALDIMSGDNVVNSVADAIPAAPASAKAALINILGTRAASAKSSVVFPLLKSDNDEVRKASFQALKTIATKEELPQLFSLLKSTSQPEEITAVQDAIIAATADIKDPSQRSQLVLQEMKTSSETQKPMFFKILASIGNRQSLDAVSGSFDKGDAVTKKAALDALSAWNGSIAESALYHIGETSNGEYLDRALDGYVRSIKLGAYTDVQKLLMLRKAMHIAKSTSQKKTILKEVGRNKTFNALIFAGEYLDDPDLQQEASHAVMGIALSDKNYSGDIVRGLLNKTMSVLKGADSDYEKEAIRKFLAEMPAGKGFVSLFNGKDLTGWKGLVADPVRRAKMDDKTLAKEQQKADSIMHKGWYAEAGILNFTGKGENICTDKKYGDFEMYVDWKITKEGDAGIYLRGTPQVQIWDTSRRDAGAEVGSGGLYNNQKNPSKPLKLADNAIGDWNTFHIIMIGDRVTVYLNGVLVTDNVILENYWDKNIPIFPEEQIELQAHGTHVAYRDIYIREISRPEPFTLSNDEKKEGFKVLFDGTNMYNWVGATESYVMEDGDMVIRPNKGGGGNLFTKDEYSDFNFRFEFLLSPGANNGLGIRAPLEGNAAYEGMELQILDNDADIYKNLQKYQYHGSVYGVIPAKRGFLKPVGEWNYEEVIVKGPKIKIILNGTVILDGDITEARENGTLDHLEHPGLKRTSGHIGFLGHGSVVRFRNIRVNDLSK
ncbi:MAG: DUF1080 domain-containing protein [Ginsengibacter sp.]